MKLTFLSAAKKFTKRYDTDGTSSSYLNQFLVSSHNEEVETPKELYRVIKDHAERGHCLMKGNLTKDLKNESRRSKTDKSAKTQWVVFDIDDLPGVDTVQDLEALIPELKDVTHILQYSSSYKITKDHFSAHVFYMLDREIEPRELKAYLGMCNFVDGVEEHIELTNSKQAITQPVDTSVADNSKLIYIAPPLLKGIKDPMDGKRILYREGVKEFLTLDRKRIDQSRYEGLKLNKLKKLRKEQGLSTTKAHMPNLKRTASGYMNTNPGHGIITVFSQDDDITRCNINGGDSCAYWFWTGRIEEDTLIHNFKGEAPFHITKFDPEFVQAYNEQFPELESRKRAFVFREPVINKYYWIRHSKRDTRFAEISLGQAVQDFYATLGGEPPGIFDEYTFVFRPHNTTIIDDKEKTINQFIPSTHLANATEIEEFEYEDQLDVLKKHCPSIWLVFNHVTGYSPEHTKRFVNWVACHMNADHLEQRVDTAWILQGTQGSGKSTVVQVILRMLLGRTEYTPNKSVKHLLDNFNQWQETAIFVELEEAYMDALGRDADYLMENTIKPMITSKELPIRGMRENPRMASNHAAYVFTSNRANPIRLQSNDRRFHAAPPQKQKLEAVCNTEDLFKQIPEEIGDFACYLKSHPCEMEVARTVVFDHYKQELIFNAMTTMDRFCTALISGDMPWMWESLLDVPPNDENFNHSNWIATSRSNFHNWAFDAAQNEATIIKVDDLRVFYNALMPDKPFKSAVGFSKALKTRGIDNKLHRVGTQRVKGIKVKWETDPDYIDSVLEVYKDKGKVRTFPSQA